MKRNKKMTRGPRGGPSWLQQALNLSELRFPPLSNEGPAVGMMISGHSASSKTLILSPPLPTQAPRKLTDPDAAF